MSIERDAAFTSPEAPLREALTNTELVTLHQVAAEIRGRGRPNTAEVVEKAIRTSTFAGSTHPATQEVQEVIARVRSRAWEFTGFEPGATVWRNCCDVLEATLVEPDAS